MRAVALILGLWIGLAGCSGGSEQPQRYPAVRQCVSDDDPLFRACSGQNLGFCWIRHHRWRGRPAAYDHRGWFAVEHAATVVAEGNHDARRLRGRGADWAEYAQGLAQP